MRKYYFILMISFFGLQHAAAQVFDVDTIQYKGSSDKLINLVILGDGYTASQQNIFISKATEFTNSLLNVSPWSSYKNYFNVFAIKVISNESGTKHPNTASDCATTNPSVPVSNPDTYFGCTFDAQGIHRLVVLQSNARLMSVLAANMPNYDHAIIIANSPYYGGSGGAIAVSTTNGLGYEVTAHELGHSFANLGDEYYAGDSYFWERPNVTQQNDPALVKWKNWITADTNIGLQNYCCGGNTANWYKPTSGTCKMEVVGAAYCRVCKESIVEKIHSLVNPVAAYIPVELNVSSSEPQLNFSLSELIKPIPNTLSIRWQLDSTVFDNNSETFQVDQNALSVGTHTLVARVTDFTDLVRVTAHSEIHFSTVTWTINKTALGVRAVADDMQVSYALYPNPSAGNFTVGVSLSKSSELAVDILTLDGKLVQHLATEIVQKGKTEKHFDIQNLANGSYLVALTIDGATYGKTLIKQDQ